MKDTWRVVALSRWRNREQVSTHWCYLTATLAACVYTLFTIEGIYDIERI